MQVFHRTHNRLQGNKWLTLCILSVGFFMILLDTTVVNVSIPAIIKDLHTNLADIEWVISAYALSFAALLITFGRLGDILGKRYLFIVGLIVFTISSALSAEAPNATLLIFARIFQGIGGAMISPSTLSIISSTFRGKERAIAFGIWGGVAGLAIAVGPIIGGFFTTYYSWRWVFRINIPIGIIGIIAALLFVKESSDRRWQRIDFWGMSLSTIGFFLLIFGLIEGQTYGWIKPLQHFTIGTYSWSNTQVSIILPIFIVSAIILSLFILLQYKETEHNESPSVNLRFFEHKTYRYGLITVAVISLGQFSSLFTLPLFFQNIEGYDALHSGLALLPTAVATLLFAPLAGRLTNRFGAKWIVTIGMFLEFIGLLLISRLQVSEQYPHLIIPLILFGTGIGLAISQNTQIVLSQIPLQESGSASGVLNTVRQVGSALGIAIIGAVLSSQIAANIQTQISSSTVIPSSTKTRIITQTQSNTSSFSYALPTLPPAPSSIRQDPVLLSSYIQRQHEIEHDIKTRIDRALVAAIGTSIMVGSAFVLLGALASLLIPNIKHHEIE